MPERVPSRLERLWRERHERDLALCEQPGGHPAGLRFDLDAGLRAVKFIEGFCRHHAGEWAGKRLILNDVQREIVTQVFGWMRADGNRRYRTAYIEVPRKFGKSTLAGGIGLYLTVADREEGAEVYSSATKKDQARIVWEAASKMVDKSPTLRRFVTLRRNAIVCRKLGSKFEPLSADSKTLDGLNPHGNIVDELHAHPTRKVWDVLDTAMGARRQPLTLAITTAGVFDPESIGWQIHDYAVKVLERVIEDDSFFAFITTADEPPKDQPDYHFTEAAQRQANPGYGVSPKAEYLARQAQKARKQAGFTSEYLRLHLNVWTSSSRRWLSLEEWMTCDPAPATPAGLRVDPRAHALARELAIEKRRELPPSAGCFGGLDLSSRLDLTSLELVFPAADGFIDVISRFWLPEATIERYQKMGRRHYRQWADEGWLTVTPGEVIDYEMVRTEVKALHARFKIRELAFDPWSALDLSNRLTEDGLLMVEVRQGYKTLSEPSKDLEAQVISHKLRHLAHPVLRFCAANAVVTTDAAGNIKPDKEKATDRIDGVVALVMAMSRLIANRKRRSTVLDAGGLLLG